MAIDPKELRIGSHYYNDGYVEHIIGRVTSINGSIYRPDDMRVGLIYDMPLDDDNDPYESTAAINLEPIPITHDLLTKSGFVKTSEYGKVSSWDRDDVRIRMIGERLDFEVSKRVYICRFQYLHELEMLYFLATKQELIND